MPAMPITRVASRRRAVLLVVASLGMGGVMTTPASGGLQVTPAGQRGEPIGGIPRTADHGGGAVAAGAPAPDSHAGTYPAGHDDHAYTPGLIGKPAEGLIPALTTLIVFGALVALLGKFAWGPIASGLKAREDKIRQDIADAERARDEARRQQAEYAAQLAGAETRIREMLAKAQVDGHELATRIRTNAQQEAEEIKSRTTRELETARVAAVASVREEAATLATAVAEKILRRNLNENDQRELVRASLDELDAGVVAARN